MHLAKNGYLIRFGQLLFLLFVWFPITLITGNKIDQAVAAEPPHLVYLPLITNSPVSSSIYWGALVGTSGQVACADNTNMQPGGPFDTFETRAQKRMAILHWGLPWYMNGVFKPFPTQEFNNVRNHGSLPLLDWDSWAMGSGPIQPDYALSKISAGQYDSYIRQWALDAKAWGHPFFLRFDWEMNGDWQFPWSEQLNGNQSGDYVQAWRHVHTIFDQAGAKNVTWVWCPNISGPTTTPMAELYPGDNYVDWTCLDGYNKENAWISFNTLFTGSGINWLSNSYQEILTVAPTKPIMIGETASIEAGDGGARKASWITDALVTQLPINFPKIKAVIWFNLSYVNQDFAIESSQRSMDAFAAAIGSSYYAANDFANADISPIPPLP
jgi:beta-mannanase